MRGGAALLVLLLAVACGRSAPGPAPAVAVSPATLRAGQAVPAPAGRPVLEVTVSGRKIPLDLATLRRMGLQRLQVFEPWIKEDQSFQGVWLADLLAVAGAPAGSSVRVTALDDYSIQLTTADLAAGGILLAVADAAGGDLAIADGGPTRIVFAGGTKAGDNPDRWIWSLRRIDVR